MKKIAILSIILVLLLAGCLQQDSPVQDQTTTADETVEEQIDTRPR